MNRNIAAYLGMSTAAVALAAAAAVAPGVAYADDITIETMPAVLSAQRAVVKAQALQRSPVDEWTLQQNGAPKFESTLTAEQAKAQYVAAREEVRALNGEDSGSMYFRKMPSRSTSVMGAPAR